MNRPRPLLLLSFFSCFLLLALFGGPLPAAEEQRFEVPVGDSPTLGPAEAPVTVVEFIDFT